MANEQPTQPKQAQRLSEAELAARILKASLLDLLTTDDEIKRAIRDLLLPPLGQVHPTDPLPEAKVAETLMILVETKIGQLVRPEALRRAVHSTHTSGPVKSS